MAEGRKREAWNHTAQLLAMIYNAHREPRSELLEPARFHPMTPRPALPKTKDLSILKLVFVDGKLPGDPGRAGVC